MYRTTITPKDLDTFSIDTEIVPELGEGVLQVIYSRNHAKYFPVANILEIDIKKLED